ncbi:serine/threonine-protein phosphatase 4 regulatory subunit 4 [Ixodes scapularis]
MRLMADDEVTDNWKLVAPRCCTENNSAVPTMPVAASKIESTDAPGGQETSKVKAFVGWGGDAGCMTHLKQPRPETTGPGVKKEVLPVVQALCQDLDAKVRAAMCLHLDALTRAIGLEATKAAILPALVELASDGECSVRLAALNAVVRMLALLDDETCGSTLVPLVCKYAERARGAEDATLPALASLLGRLCLGLSGTLTKEQHSWFLDLYRRLATLGLNRHNSVYAEDLEPVPESSQFGAAQCRHACAHNFPAMVLYVGIQDFESQLLGSLETLCSDPEPAVRATMAAGMHQVISQLEGHGGWPGLLLGHLVSLLWDASLNVLQALVPNLEACLAGLIGCVGATPQEQQLVSLLDALEGCETALGAGPRWRLHASVLGALSALCYPPLPRQLHSRLGSMLLSRSRSASLLVCLRHSPCEADRGHLLQGILQELGSGRSCRSRMQFVRLCGQAVQVLPEALFKNHFLEALLKLSGDPVANVRLLVCSCLPGVKGLLRLPEDGAALASLEAAVTRRLTSETDRDVLAALQRAIDALDQTEVASGPETLQSVPSTPVKNSLRSAYPWRESRLPKAASLLPRRAKSSPEKTPIRVDAEKTVDSRLSAASGRGRSLLRADRVGLATADAKLRRLSLGCPIKLQEPRAGWTCEQEAASSPSSSLSRSEPNGLPPSRIPTPRISRRRRPQSECLEPS